MRLRQVALVARDLDATVADLRAVLGVEVAHRDPDVAVFGLRNAVLPVGAEFLEVVSPLRDGTTAGRLLDRRGGDGGYMVIVQDADLAPSRARAAAAGVRIAWEVTLPDAATIHLHPRDLGGAIVSVDWMATPALWRWAGPDWSRHVATDVVRGIAGVEVQGDDPAAMAARWAAVLGAPIVAGAGGAPELRLASGWVRFVPAADGRGEGVSAIALRVADRDELSCRARTRGLLTESGRLVLGGVRWLLDAA
jgi:catechol 2,3-dioxygenase-like lactoylglutathione lyase family enzyme